MQQYLFSIQKRFGALGWRAVCSRNLHPNFNKQIFETIKNTLWRTDLPTIDSRCNATWQMQGGASCRIEWTNEMNVHSAHIRTRVKKYLFLHSKNPIHSKHSSSGISHALMDTNVITIGVCELYIYSYIWTILAHASRKNVTQYSLAILIASQSINTQIEWISNKFCFMCSNHLWFIPKRAKRGRATVREHVKMKWNL